MANIELIKGAATGDLPDQLGQAYPKINRSMVALNTELVGHKASSQAHNASAIAYNGSVAGVNDVKAAIDAQQAQISNLVVTGDSGPEAAAARVDTVTGTTYPDLSGRLNAEKALLVDSANKIFELIRTSNNKFVAHRGAMDLYPENTRIALERSCASGYFGIEFDILLTSDGEWIVMHDDAVDRTTNGTGLVKSKTLSQIKELTIDAGANVSRYPGMKVPTLEEVLIMCKNYATYPCIEIKDSAPTSAAMDKLVSLIRQYGFEDKCAIISFSRNHLTAIRERSRRIALMLNENMSSESITWLKNKGNGIISSPFEFATKELVEEAHRNGVAVVTYSINTVEAARGQLAIGVDLMTTNRLI